MNTHHLILSLTFTAAGAAAPLAAQTTAPPAEQPAAAVAGSAEQMYPPATEEVVSANLLITTPPPPLPPMTEGRNDHHAAPMAAQGAGASPAFASGAHALREFSMFAVEPPQPRLFVKHDLIQIIVAESSRARRSHELETDKQWAIDGRVSAWPDFRVEELLQLMLRGGDGENLPQVGVEFDKEFTGEGEYERRDDLSDRLTAEVIEVLPNGNMVVEARTRITTDEEISCMTLTGICRPEDISPVNTVLSNQIHDLNIQRSHEGELKRTNEKGIIAKVLEAVFAF